MSYRLFFVPSGEAGIAQGFQTTFVVDPGGTIALDDVLKTWFARATDSTLGSLEIRPETPTQQSTSSAALGALEAVVTFASARTFSITPAGTFGQYVPVVPFANFAAKGTTLSLQQIAQSAKFRTNLGLLEGSGQPAELLVRILGGNGAKLTEFLVSLKGGQHTQLNGVLAQHGVADLENGRIEINVKDGGGKITAYASVLDNQTNDPLLVPAVPLAAAGNTRWVLPGMADLTGGAANWRSDVRLLNAGAEPVELTLTFHSKKGGEPKSRAITLAPGGSSPPPGPTTRPRAERWGSSSPPSLPPRRSVATRAARCNCCSSSSRRSSAPTSASPR
jgi:hypothetical protein